MMRLRIGFLVALAASCEGSSKDAGVPPSGDYTVTMRVVADDCTPRFEPPSPWDVDVVSKSTDGRVVVNVPLSALPPQTDTDTLAQSNIVLVPAEPQTRKNPRGMDPSCSFKEQRIEVTAVSRGGFTLAITSSYGERPGVCKDTLPAQCTTRVEQVYTLSTP